METSRREDQPVDWLVEEEEGAEELEEEFEPEMMRIENEE
jgi:hypothetical protein